MVMLFLWLSIKARQKPLLMQQKNEQEEEPSLMAEAQVYMKQANFSMDIEPEKNRINAEEKITH